MSHLKVVPISHCQCILDPQSCSASCANAFLVAQGFTEQKVSSYMFIFSDVAGSGISDLADLRLVNGSDKCSGRLEVFHDQRWGTVCADGWDLAEAYVVCRQLGCGAARSASSSSRFGEGPHLTWVDAVECIGMERALFECKVKLWGAQSCKSKGYASVVCSEAVGQCW